MYLIYEVILITQKNQMWHTCNLNNDFFLSPFFP